MDRYAVVTLIAFVLMLPFALFLEGSKVASGLVKLYYSLPRLLLFFSLFCSFSCSDDAIKAMALDAVSPLKLAQMVR